MVLVPQGMAAKLDLPSGTLIAPRGPYAAVLNVGEECEASTVQIYERGEPAGKIDLELSASQDPIKIFRMAWSPDGLYLVFATRSIVGDRLGRMPSYAYSAELNSRVSLDAFFGGVVDSQFRFVSRHVVEIHVEGRAQQKKTVPKKVNLKKLFADVVD
ncbi:MAG: hypothetical protein V4498_05415 [candidate division FCPU426 bacterium]